MKLFRLVAMVLASSLLLINQCYSQDVNVPSSATNGADVLRHVLVASGMSGDPAAIQDMTASGAVSVPSSQSTTGFPIVISLKGNDKLRTDTQSARGHISQVFNHDRSALVAPDHISLPARKKQNFTVISQYFPLRGIAIALSNSEYTETLVNTKSDEQAVYRVHVVKQSTTTRLSSAPSESVDFIIDSSTNLITEVRTDYAGRPGDYLIPGTAPQEIYRFSDYRAEAGIMLPHTISTSIDKRAMGSISISSYRVNTGIVDNAFTLDGK